MGYGLIWIESLAAAWLLAALVTACGARSPSRLRQVVTTNLAAVLLLVGPGVFVWGVGVLAAQGVVLRGTFIYFLSWVVALVVGVILTLDRGLRRTGEDGAPAARAWPRGRLAIGFGVAAVLAGITLSNMDLAMKVQLAAVRAESGARVLALMPPRVADHDNAAPLYQEAFAALTPENQLRTPWRQKARAWLDAEASFDLQDRDLAKFLQSQERGLALLRRASALPGCSFERDYFLDLGLALPEMEQFRRGAGLLGLDARVKAARGDVRGALDDVAALFRMARHVNEPILVCLVVSAAIDRRAVAALEDVLAGQAAKPEDLARVAPGEVSYGRAVQRCVQMEEAGLGVPTMIATVSSANRSKTWVEAEGQVPAWASAILASPLYRVFFFSDDLANYRRNMKVAHDLAGRPSPAARAGWIDLERSIRSNRSGGILAGLIVPAAGRCAELAARTDALHGLARLAIAAEVYRARAGQWPARLEDLTPEHLARVPTDPFTGKPLRLRPAGKDLVLSSVGPEESPFQWGPTGAISFRLRGR
jgi:hypothetical protein